MKSSPLLGPLDIALTYTYTRYFWLQETYVILVLWYPSGSPDSPGSLIPEKLKLGREFPVSILWLAGWPNVTQMKEGRFCSDKKIQGLS